MFRIIRSFSLTICFTLAWTCVGFAQGVPITGEYDFGGTIAVETRGTCDPSVMEVIKNQAWEAGQREITQNANIYTRPDSVLSLTCFDSWLNHQATYAANHFPVDPDESEGKLFGGIMTDLTIVLPDDIITGVDPNKTVGYVQYGILEILVLDQLEDVSSITGEAADFPGFAVCGGGKDRYIRDSFPDLMIGDRAKNQNSDPVYSSIFAGLGNGVSDSSSYSCNMMAQVWERTKCYDFATEDNEFYHSGSAYTGAIDHDGIYTYDDYVAFAAGQDYRMEPDMCRAPNSTLITVPGFSSLLCYEQIHGKIGMPVWSNNAVWSASVGGFAWIPGRTYSGAGPDWATAHNAANPVAGAAGSGDAYNHYLGLVSGTALVCSPPIRTGFVVVREDSQYYDAVCPNPGCFFTAPNTMVGIGRCSR